MRNSSIYLRSPKLCSGRGRNSRDRTCIRIPTASISNALGLSSRFAVRGRVSRFSPGEMEGGGLGKSENLDVSSSYKHEYEARRNDNATSHAACMEVSQGMDHRSACTIVGSSTVQEITVLDSFRHTSLFVWRRPMPTSYASHKGRTGPMHGCNQRALDDAGMGSLA